jgi:outer membrane biogenesis lipoprotein LolB
MTWQEALALLVVVVFLASLFLTGCSISEEEKRKQREWDTARYWQLRGKDK